VDEPATYLKMNSKKQHTKHMADITKPKKPATTAPAGPQLVIPKRSMTVPVAAAEPDAPAAEAIAVKRTAKNIEPEESNAATPEPKPEPPPASAKPAEPAADPPEAPSRQAAASDPPDPPEDVKPPSVPELDPKAQDSATPASGQTHPQVRKALEDAKHQEEIQQHIENRDFFVPVNAVARKRSIKVSAALILVELLLGLLLLNLMLDAGLIELLYKIPHTNFFHV
jgi:hypothetical protein